jgi:hypothetical protein
MASCTVGRDRSNPRIVAAIAREGRRFTPEQRGIDKAKRERLGVVASMHGDHRPQRREAG